MIKNKSSLLDNENQILNSDADHLGICRSSATENLQMIKNVSVTPLNMYQSLIPPNNTEETGINALSSPSVIQEKGLSNLDNCKKATLIIISSRIFFILVIIANIYAIFINPLYSILFTKKADPAFDTLCMFAITIFVTEISLQLFAIKEYFLNFYFFIDVISTIVLFFDLTFVYYPLFYGQDDGVNFFAGIKILRVVRVLRLVRILKLVYKYGERKGQKVKPSKKRKSEAEITKILKESNLRKLIILILVILIAIPFFDSSVYINVMQTDLIYKAPFILRRLLMKGVSFFASIDELKGIFASNATELIYLRINNQEWSANTLYLLRPSEWNRYRSIMNFEGVDYAFDIIVNVRYQAQLTSLLLFLNSLLITAIMAGSIYSLNKDMSDLVLNPLERMIQKVKEVSKDPLQVMKGAESNEVSNKNTNETLFIETAISKISQLLVLGFGQAGCKIISYYLQESSSELDDKIPGVKVHAIFGFCDIRQFTDATEVLLEGVTTFVNSIAEIVHQAVDTFGGAANKNIGDAFLLVWKLHSLEGVDSLKNLIDNLQDLTEEEVVRRINELNASIAEMALLSFVKVIININTLPSVVHYSQNPLLVRRIPQYAVRMGFGLHEGWAIEGAIGSQYKIDASYLSPNVNMASRLEAATKQFRTEILFSGNVFQLFHSSKLRSLCRHIDTVTVKGSIHPLRLYTIDLNIAALADTAVCTFAQDQVKLLKIRKEVDLRQKFKELSKKIISNDFKDDSFSKLMRANTFEKPSSGTLKILKQQDFAAILNFPDIDFPTFRIIFSHALDNYLLGKWAKAREYFNRCLRFKKDDGPTSVILDYMHTYDYSCPQNWKNCRELIDK